MSDMLGGDQADKMLDCHLDSTPMAKKYERLVETLICRQPSFADWLWSVTKLVPGSKVMPQYVLKTNGIHLNSAYVHVHTRRT